MVLSLNAQSNQVIDIGRVSPGEIDYAGFKLDKDATVHIEGAGASFEKWGKKLAFYGWIIDSESRELVWSLLDVYESEYFHGEGSFDFKTDIELKKGSYEIYFTGMYDNSYTKYQVNDFTDLIQEVMRAIADDNEQPYYRNEKYYMTLSGKDGFTANKGREYLDKMAEKSIVSIVRTGDDEIETRNFSLIKETKLYVYCQGEKDGRRMYDFAWIYDLKTREKVWPNNLTDYDRAGGGRKNFLAFQELNLPAGDYEVQYITDGSHSYDRWNVMPPDDPQMWGITIWSDNEDKKNVSNKVKEFLPVVDLTRVGDNEFESQGFELTQDMDVRIICIGEISDYDPDDYGWIIDANTREEIWMFTRSRSEPAGGAAKNRKVNEVISLKKGKYIAYFASDGSHSYRDWNAEPPYDQKMWGLSLWAVTEKDKAYFKLFNEEELNDKNVIAEITRVTDNVRKYKDFILDKELKVRVYAIGEGDDGDMYDTGWIKNMDTGKIIWEMTYRTSEHAGGAYKNRMFNNYIILPKGNYRLYFESDGSHSYMDWNDDPPRDQMNYGIKILKE
ncbi:MAG: hypothetical protein C0597_08645 [Marinilabiliales bacterium]|nr:MAG: hypothetical protein C0597_08645 [Marinilabiliales bacterium]